ncbi:BTB domain containing protein [Acanthamoeba polyphaga moumouvirus]|uniref:BTB domain containing protein n=1 Tax=Acanthamoeba polyphaga moumouvirus TaxID=1269028 RepID=L7RDX3_9VIRU|nr:BTB domain containing protein [Acanthamoeba polyphaga moumouvirus]AGC02303.1 BTB domain containing protein [Acanthamoeba polyphaga moumouvirus]
MDFANVFNTEILSDTELILIDKNNKKYLKLHKLILYTKSPFFQKLFTTFFKGKIKSQIILEVFDVDVCIDIIKSFYGVEILPNDNWKYQISNYMCRQQLLLESSLSKELKIPENEFEEFLSIILSREYNDEIIDLISINLPLNFNLNKLPIDLIKERDKKYIDLQILTIGNKGIYIVDIYNNKCNKIINGSFNYLDYEKNSDKIIAKKGNLLRQLGYGNKFFVYDLLGNEIKLNEYMENKNCEHLLKNLDEKHFGFIYDYFYYSEYYIYYHKHSLDYKKLFLSFLRRTRAEIQMMIMTTIIQNKVFIFTIKKIKKLNIYIKLVLTFLHLNI